MRLFVCVFIIINLRGNEDYIVFVNELIASSIRTAFQVSTSCTAYMDCLKETWLDGVTPKSALHEIFLMKIFKVKNIRVAEQCKQKCLDYYHSCSRLLSTELNFTGTRLLF